MKIWQLSKKALNIPATTAQLLMASKKIEKFVNQDMLPQALELALQIHERVGHDLGEHNPLYATSLNNLATIQMKRGEYSEAESLLKQGLEITLATVGEKHPLSAMMMQNLAGLYYETYNYSKAETLLQQTDAVLFSTMGNTAKYAMFLSNLATVYEATGKFNQSEMTHLRALDLIRKIKGSSHQDIAPMLNSIASLYFERGEYTKALQLLREALEIQRKAYGEDHTETALYLQNLAELYRRLDYYADAEPLYQQALRILRLRLTEEHLRVASCLNNLALLYTDMRKFDIARPICEEALAIRLKILGEMNAQVASSLNNLAFLQGKQGNHNEAETLYRRVLLITRQTLGEDHPNVALGLHNLAAQCMDRQNYSEAERLLQQALSMRQRILGASHPDIAVSLTQLGGLYAQTNRKLEALTLLSEAEVIHDQLIGYALPGGTEIQRLQYLKGLRHNFYGFLSLTHTISSSNDSIARTAFDLVLRRKAISADVLAVQRDAILQGKYPALYPKYQELHRLRQQIARFLLAGPKKEDQVTIYQKRVAEWKAKQDLLEFELATQIPEMNLTKKLQEIQRNAVAQALPPGSALVEFVHFHVYQFDRTEDAPVWQKSRYLAFLLHAKQPDNVQMLDLGLADEIDEQIVAHRNMITFGQDTADRHILPAHTVKNSIGNESSGKILRQRIFDPLLKALAGCRYLFVAPDASLNLIPFEVLPIDDGDFLFEHYHINYVSTGRDLLNFKQPATAQLAPALVIADPDFDLEEGTEASPDISDNKMNQLNDYDPLLPFFQPLPETGVEGREVAKILGVYPYLQADAVESKIKKCHSPGILHLATHGFSFIARRPDIDDQQPSSPTYINRHNRLDNVMKQLMGNPLLCSGLAFAGANTWNRGGHLPLEAEDGILTAEDVTGLDLSGTELVVLSACDTGLGKLQEGEGVFGLRRAFQLAGARRLLISLWKVPDQQTRELMIHFYLNIKTGLSYSEALYNAQQSMKQKYPHPYYWGAFIFQGEHGSL